MNKPDFRVENHGSIILVWPLTQAAKNWLHGHTEEDSQWHGSALAVEPRYTDQLVHGMECDGLVQG